MKLATIICIGLLLAMEGSQAQEDPSLEERCSQVKTDFQNCAKTAHQDYAVAMSVMEDGREAFTARKACNYITQSVEVCGDMLIGECNSEEKVQEMKDKVLDNFERTLSSRDYLWDSEKCPPVKAYLDRKRAREGGYDVIAQEQSSPPETESESELEPEEVGQAATIEEQVSSLRNETQIKKQTLTRLEAFFEQLERRILRLEAANNGTRGVTESVQESMTSPAPETTTNLPCCQKIKLKSRFRAPIRSFLGVYVYNNLEPEDLSVEVDFEWFYYEKFSEGGETLSNGCENELAGFNSIHDECGEQKLKFMSGFTGSCITGPKLYTVHWYNEGQGFWEEDDSLTIVCVD